MAQHPQGLSMAGKAFFGSLCAGTFGLGVWQTQRYFEKQTLVAERQAALSQPPLNGLCLDNKSSSSFRRMRLQGRYLYDKECLVGPRGPPQGALPDKPGYSGGGMSRAPLGYFVVSPLQLLDKSNDTNRIVLVNRGWVPRHLVYDETRPSSSSRSHTTEGHPPSSPTPPRGRPQQPRRLSPTWDRPEGTVHVTCVSSLPEQPRFLVAEHKLVNPDNGTKLTTPELYWMDLDTLQRHVESSVSDKDDADATSMPLVTAVQDKDDENGSNDKDSDMLEFHFPLSPPAQNVGDFKTSPEIHAGYALTWYGLSAAGLYMTRKLMLKR